MAKSDLAWFTVDTTVPEKNLAYPADSKLPYTAIMKLGDAAKSYWFELRQS